MNYLKPLTLNFFINNCATEVSLEIFKSFYGKSSFLMEGCHKMILEFLNLCRKSIIYKKIQNKRFDLYINENYLLYTFGLTLKVS